MSPFYQAVPYDFKKCQRLPEQHLNALRTLHQQFAENITEELSQLFKTKTTVTLESIDQPTAAYVQRSLAATACCARFDLHPLPGFGTIILENSIAYSVISRMLGGDGEPPAHLHPFTNLEMAINRKFINIILKQLKTAWAPLSNLSFAIDEINADLNRFLNQHHPYDPFITSYFKTTLGSATGYIVLLFPISSLSSIQKNFDEVPAQNSTPNLVNLDQMEIELTASLGTVLLSSHELQNLKPGDVIDLQKNIKTPIDLCIFKAPVLTGTPGLIGKNKGVLLSIKKSHKE